MTEDEKLSLSLSEKLLKLMLNEKIPFEKKKDKMDYLVRIGADVNAIVYGKSMALWASETGDDKIVEYIKEKGGVENQISKKESEELGNQFWDENGEVKSVKEIKELVLMGADLSVRNDYDKQIWKNLSFEEMNEVLKDLPKGYVIDGDVNLSEKGLTELPDFSKIKVKGYFDCRNNQLTTLKGAPREVGESFNCSYNQLTALQGAPEKVGGSFDCSYNNPLKDLRGAPSVVGGDFWCNYNNKLATLEGGPSEVGGFFDCSYNQLTDLRGAPRKVGVDFNCKGNRLTTLDGKPQKIGGEFMIEEEVLARIKKKNIKNIFEKIFGGDERM